MTASGRRRAGLMALGGVALCGLGVVYGIAFAGIPYQDPTPELQRRYAFHDAVSGWICAVGMAVVAGAAGWWGAASRGRPGAAR